MDDFIKMRPVCNIILVLVVGLLLGYLFHSFLMRFRVKKNKRWSEGMIGKDFEKSESLYTLERTNDWKEYVEYNDMKEVSIGNKAIKFFIKAETCDEWAYLYLDPKKYAWRNYSWNFSLIRSTCFREFAFNFRYQDFDNRYRYRFEDDYLFFDKKVKGIWYNNISSIPYQIDMEIKYKVQIECFESLMRCYVNGKLCLENVDTDLDKGSISIILWEDDGCTDAVAEVADIEVFSLEF